MFGIVKWFGSLMSSGLITKVFAMVDKQIEAETDREKIKSEIIMSHYQNRGDFMRSGGFVLMMLFAVPLAVWFASVCLYSMIWHANGLWPQDWDIAALPAPLDDWAGGIIVSIFGVIGVSQFRK